MLSASAARAISPMHVCSRRRGLLGKQKADDLMQRKFDVILVLLEFFFFLFHADECTAAHSTCATLPEPSSLPPLPFPVVSRFTKKQKKTRGKQNRLPPRGKRESPPDATRLRLLRLCRFSLPSPSLRSWVSRRTALPRSPLSSIDLFHQCVIV